MKPTDYTRYASSIDLLSHPDFDSNIQTLVTTVINTVPENNNLLDIGGGTGYVLRQIIEKRPDINAIMLEPSKEMFQLAHREPPQNTQIVNLTFQEAYKQLPQADNMLFCRSLYSFSGIIEDYPAIFKNIYNKLNAFGHLFILEPGKLYDIDNYEKHAKNYLRQINKASDTHWPVIRDALTRFNKGVQNGEFVLLDTQKLTSLAHQQGFNTKFINETIHVFRKAQ